MTARKKEREPRKLPLALHTGVGDLLWWVCVFHRATARMRRLARCGKRGREFIRRRLQSKEVIIFSRSVARSLIKVAAERNQQGPHQFNVSSFFIRETPAAPLLYRWALRYPGDSLSNLITATFNWICDRRESTFDSPCSDWRSSLSISHLASLRFSGFPLTFVHIVKSVYCIIPSRYTHNFLLLY